MSFSRKYLYLICVLFAFWLGFRYALPVILPFGLGALLALAAEPAVRFGANRLHLPRWASAGLGVGLTLIALISILWLLGSLLVKEVGALANALPDLQDTAQQGLNILQAKVTRLSEKMPAGLGKLLSGAVTNLSGSSTALFEQTARRLPEFVGSAASKMSRGVIGAGTGVLAAFLISVRLPTLRASIGQKIPVKWKQILLPALGRIRSALGGWLKAQGLLMLITFCIVCVGLLLLRVPYAPFLALLIALIDAVPMLGTGIVLIPWALVRLLQNAGLHALGLIGIFAAATLSRTVLEPKLVGKHIGLDPLVTLFAMYAGFRFFGILGLILAPMTAATVKAAIGTNPAEKQN